MSWTPFNRTGRVLFSFEPSGEYQIALQEGERVQVTEQASGWFKGTVLSRQPPSSGIFPASYIKLDPEGSSPPDASASASSPASAAPETRPSAPSRAPALPQRGPSDSSAAPGLARAATVDDIGFRSEVSKASAKILEDKDWEGLFAEINGIMNEWSKRLVVLLTSGDADAYHDAKESMSALLELRARVLRETDESRREVLRTEIIHLIERGRESQEGFLVTRTKDGDIADVSNTPTVSLLEQHRSMDKSLKTEREEGWRDRNQARRRESLLAQGALNAPPVDLPKGLMQLYLDVQMCIFSAHENTELFFSLYNRAQQAYITDDFLVSLTDLGLPHNKMLIGKLYTLFKDLDRQSFDGGLYLVCKIFRRGRLVYAPTKKPDPKSDYRRPFGCMVMNLSTAGLTDFEKHEFPPQQIYVLRDGVHEKNWCKIVDLVLSNDNKLLEPLKKAKGVVMALQLHTGTEEEVRAEFEYDPEVVATTPRFEFPEQMQVTDNRNDFYVFLDYGQFLKDGKRSEKNIEVHVQVLDSTGQPRENCIVRGCGPAAEPQTEFKSLVYYHWNTPSYDEAIRVLLDVEQFHDSHLFLSFWHVSSKASKSNCFSWGYFKLTRDRGAVVADAIHTVNTFTPWHKKLEKNTGSYLEDLGKYKRRKDPEIFHVRSKLVSTIQTQNATLHTLFNWRTVATPVLLEALKDFARFNRTSVAELAKFVRETFDVLFAIMASPEHVECHTPALDATLHALGLLTDRKIQTYIPIVDSYVTSLFKEGSVHVLMIEALTERFTSCDNDPDMKVMNLARSLDYVLKFAVASRLIDVNSDSPTCDDATFKANLQGLFTPLFELMAIDPSTTKARYLQQTQSFLIRSFPRMVEDLGKVFSAQETGEIARRLVLAVDNVPRHTISKLNLVRLLIKGNVVEHADFRAVFTPVVLSVLKRHMAELSHESPSTSESYLCISIVGRLLNSVQTDMMATADPADRAALVAPFRDVLLEMLNMVDFIQRGEMGEFALKRPSETVRNFVKVDMLLDGVTVLWTALHALEEDALGEVFSSQPRERLVESARRLLRVASTSLQHRMYEPKWVALVMLHLHIVTKVLRVMGSLLRQCFASDGDDFDADVWNAYFVLSLQMLSLDRLRLSSFSAKKREFVLARYGDLREGIMEHIRELWTALGARRADFAGNLIPLIFDLAASTSKEDAVNDFAQAADLALDMFYDMLRTEFEASGSFDEVERHTIDALYRMIEHKPDECDAFVELVLSTTRQSIQATGGGALVAQGDAFLDHVQRMYDLMSSLLQFPHTELYEDERTSVVLKIIHYLETSGHVRKEMTSRYMQYLVDLHAGLGNFVEAGITQLALYNLLDFSDAPIDRTDMFPREPERDRKVRVLKLAVANLVQGEDFERAIGLLDLLVAYYRRTYQYRELSAVLAEQSDLYAKIMDTQRFYCNFYQVGYYGDFADEFKGKVFVYKGNKLESVMAFTSRMRTKFPDAKIHMSSEEPSEELVQEHGQVIGITTLTPERAETDKAVENGAAPVESASQDAMPIKVAAHLNANDIKVFSYAKPDNRSPEKRPKNEFKDMWKFTTYLETTDSLPCNRRRVEIASRRVIESPPIENAVQAMEKTNAEFHLQLRQLREAGGPANAPDLVQPVAMRVGGAVDAAVNGGVLLYIEAFLCPEFATEHPEWVQYQQPLRDAIKASLELCDEALELLSPPPASMEALMEHLTSTQAKNKESYAEVLGL